MPRRLRVVPDEDFLPAKFKHDRWRPRKLRAVAVWDTSEWWQQRAAEVSGACGKCGGFLQGVYSMTNGGRVVVAHCLTCGAERAVLVQESTDWPPVAP